MCDNRLFKACLWSNEDVLSFGFFTKTQNWQYWHYCQLCIPIYMQFPSLFTPHDVSKCDIRYQWVQADYISRLKTLLVLFISNGTAKTKLAIFGILVFHRVCAKPSWARAVWRLLITAFFEALSTPTKQKIFILNKSKGFLTSEIANDTYMYSFQSWTFSGKYIFVMV